MLRRHIERNKRMRTIDLSHPLAGGTPSYPGDPPFVLAQDKAYPADGYNCSSFCVSCHTGTHVDVPRHFFDRPETVADFPLEAFAGPGVLLDVRGEGPIDVRPEYRQRVFPGSVVLLYTGWDRVFGQAGYFSEHPAVTEALARLWLERGVAMVGLDMPSPDHMPHPVHKLLLAHNILLLENLTGLSALAGVEAFEVLAYPLRLAAEGSPVRAVARVAD